MVDFQVRVVIDSTPAVAGARRVKRELDGIGSTALRVQRLIRQALTIVAGANLVRRVVDLADTYQNLENRLKAVARAGEDLSQTQLQLLEISNRSRASLSSVTQIYSRLALSAKNLGLNQRQLTDFTESLAKTISISGASSYEAQGALIQFSQAMASGALRGDELRSVLEQFPEVANVIAQRFGVAAPQLAKLGETGAITSQQIIAAFQDAREEIEARFGKTIPTVAQSFTVLNNQLLTSIGQLNKTSGASQSLSKFILFLAKNLDAIGNAVKNLAFLLGPSVLLKALTALKVAIASNPLGLLLVAVSTLIAVLPDLQTGLDDLVGSVVEIAKSFLGLQDSVLTTGEILQSFGADVLDVIGSAVSDVVGLFAGLYNSVDALWTGLAQSPKAFAELMFYYITTAANKTAAFMLATFQSIGDVIIQVGKDIFYFFTESVAATSSLIAGNWDAAEGRAENAKGALNRIGAAMKTIGGRIEGNFAKLDQPLEEELQRLRYNISDDAKELGDTVANSFDAGFEDGAAKVLNTVKGLTQSIRDELAQAGLERTVFFSGVLESGTSFQENLPPSALRPPGAQGFAPRGAAPPGVTVPLPEQGVPGKATADLYNQELESLYRIIAVEEERRALGDQQAEQLDIILGLQSRGLTLTEDEEAMLRSVIQLRQDTQAIAQLEQQLDATKQQVEQERLLNMLLEDRRDLADVINAAILDTKIAALEASTALADGFERAFLKLQKEAQDLAAVGEQVVNVFANKMTDALVTFLETGEFKFKEFAYSILQEITRILVRLLIVQAIQAALGGGGGAPVNDIGAALGGGGGRADGGTVQPDRSYIVGEEGPELFQPRTTGTIVPNAGSVPAEPPQVNVSVVNVDDPSAVPSAINKGDSDEAIINVLARNRDRVRQTIG